MNASKNEPWCDVCGVDDGASHDVFEHVMAVLEEYDMPDEMRAALAPRLVVAAKRAMIANVTIALGGGS